MLSAHIFNNVQVLGKFIARAVADDCLPPAFVKNYTEDTSAESLQRKALSRADVLLKMKHGMVRLDNVWGVGGGRRPVKQLIKKMVLLLKEYLSSEDIEEVVWVESIPNKASVMKNL
jgi:programmed cell death protein 4